MSPDRCEDTVLMIRMWREPGVPRDGSDWRGRVDLLTEGKRRLFVGADSLREILDLCLQADDPAHAIGAPAPTSTPDHRGQSTPPSPRSAKTC